MGNQAANINQRRSTLNPNKSKFSRNSYSLESNSLLSQYRQKIDKDALSIREVQPSPVASPILLERVSQLAKDEPISNHSLKATEDLVKATMKKSSSVPLNNKKSALKLQNDSRLAKLNEKNDELRKQLIKISSQLSSQLNRKKFQQKKKVIQPPKEQDLPKIMAMRRELQNGYKQINRVKKYIQNLKKNQGNARNQDLMNEVQAKINNVQFDISEIMFEIENAREVNQDIKLQLEQTSGIADFTELDPFKAEIVRLRKYAKRLYKNERLKFQKEKVQQEYMFQLERKKREILGQYLPEIKSYANKNYQPDIKSDKKKTDEYANYKPAAWQIRNAEEQLQTLREKHEEYHIKMDKALKSKNTIKEQYEQVKKDIQSANKQLEQLTYKKERYMQLVMGNLQYLMNQVQEQVSENRGGNDKNMDIHTIRIITKGNDLPDQKLFDDHNIIPNADYTKIQIVSINIWFTSKHQISAIQMIYSDGKDCFLGNRSSSVSGEMQKQVLELQQGDFIRNIMGIFNKRGAIQFLAFYSAQGKAKQFGKQMINGLNFTLGLSRRERPVCFSGYSFFDGNYWRINKISVDVAFQE